MRRQLLPIVNIAIVAMVVLFLGLAPLLLSSPRNGLEGAAIAVLWPFESTLSHYKALHEHEIQVISEGYPGVYLVQPAQGYKVPSVQEGFMLLPAVLGLGCDFSLLDQAAVSSP